MSTQLGELRVPSLGVAGCGIATAIVMWCQWLAARALLRRDAFYVPFGLHRPGLRRPQAAAQRALLKLGVPMGLSIALEITGFTFMALFISRLGATPVAGHQIAVNLVSLMFMMPLSLGNAACTLVAQRLGANDLRDARRSPGTAWSSAWSSPRWSVPAPTCYARACCAPTRTTRRSSPPPCRCWPG